MYSYFCGALSIVESGTILLLVGLRNKTRSADSTTAPWD